MAPSESEIAEQEERRGLLPEGTLAVGAGIAVAGLSAYAFTGIAGQVLGPVRYAELNALWVLIFPATLGFFQPLEQEVGRAIIERRLNGAGSRPLVKRAFQVGGFATVSLLLVIALLARPLANDVFDGQELLVWSLAIGIVAYFFQFILRGVLAGNARFGPYGLLMGAEGAIRALLAIILWVVGVKTAGPFGLVLCAAPLVAVFIALANRKGLLDPGPPAPLAELSSKLGYLLVGSVLTQLIGYSAVLVAYRYHTDSQKAEVGTYVAGFFTARIPILLFQAVQAALLPKLAKLAGPENRGEFRSRLQILLILVGAIAGLGTIGAAALGPWAVKTLFGAEYIIGRDDITYLALGSGLFMLALTMAQALIALNRHSQVAYSWIVGFCAVALVVAIEDDLFMRAGQGFVAGSLASAVMMALLLATRIRARDPADASGLLEALSHEPIEM